jgi:hypothetical protein
MHPATSQAKGKQRATQGSAVPKVQWERDPPGNGRTDRLIDWLEDHPVDRHKLFSDSTQDACNEGRSRDVGKTKKKQYYEAIAAHVFKNDENPSYREGYQQDPARYAGSVDSRLTS